MHSLMAFAAPASAQPVDTSPATQAQAALHTPDVIASAVRPYAACLYGVRGLPLLLGTNGAPVTYDKKDGDCSAERQRARAAALKLLANTPVPGGITAAAFVDGTLADMDAFVATLPARRSGGSSGRAPAVGIPMMIEDEVRPPFDRYEECLK